MTPDVAVTATVADDGPVSHGCSSSPTAAAAAAADTIVQKKINENNRRSNKPIMEKKRRARINNCLNELKTLILDATKKDPARHSKLEKADILEMTVKHLESVQRHNVALCAATESTVANKFQAGFTECTNEVNRFPGLEPQVRKRLMQHLGAYFVGKSAAAAAATATDDCDAAATPPSPSPSPHNVQLRLDSNAILLGSAGSGSVGGLQLVPTRLPNGDIALVLPSSTRSGIAAAAVLTPPRTPARSTGTESPAPADDRPSSRHSAASYDSTAAAAATAGATVETFGSPPPASVTAGRGRNDDDRQSDPERPWRPW